MADSEDDYGIDAPDPSIDVVVEAAANARYRPFFDAVFDAVAEAQGDAVEDDIAETAAAYARGDLVAPPPDDAEDDDFAALARDNARLIAQVGIFTSQVRGLRGALRRVLQATERYSDSRRAPWWLEANNALRRAGVETDAS